jgi:hypothetical protein
VVARCWLECGSRIGSERELAVKERSRQWTSWH